MALLPVLVCPEHKDEYLLEMTRFVPQKVTHVHGNAWQIGKIGQIIANGKKIVIDDIDADGSFGYTTEDNAWGYGFVSCATNFHDAAKAVISGFLPTSMPLEGYMGEIDVSHRADGSSLVSLKSGRYVGIVWGRLAIGINGKPKDRLTTRAIAEALYAATRREIEKRNSELKSKTNK